MQRFISDRVSETIRKRIVEGEYEIGEKLPTEEELCREFSVGRSSVREAMRMLQAKGFVSIRQGYGTTVVSRMESISGATDQWLRQNRENLADYMQVRYANESLALRLFIARYDAERFERLCRIEERFEAAVEQGDTEQMAAMDEDFHKHIFMSTGNQLVIDINTRLADAFRTYRLVTFAHTQDRRSAVELHRRIIEAVRVRDTQTALYELQEHLNTSLKNALRGQEEGASQASVSSSA